MSAPRGETPSLGDAQPPAAAAAEEQATAELSVEEKSQPPNYAPAETQSSPASTSALITRKRATKRAPRATSSEAEAKQPKKCGRLREVTLDRSAESQSATPEKCGSPRRVVTEASAEPKSTESSIATKVNGKRAKQVSSTASSPATEAK
ncbi:hypothetical protein N7539_004543 [Penicillium diatomitis]|uniref:Uncharacterized protein n=1 Tax=Penicillium diatomitis TaxID=2819901 RepID=A0A9W9XF01_9EURO|nr:uncharacterized protein N7539_004543 [Penicillium diatomitis]KAJ5489653.1 hypothetical protein N7539_004543 [Penicillium diatomitis]